MKKCHAVNGILLCDRDAGHAGSHRGYNDQIDEPMFWTDESLDLEKLIAVLVSMDEWLGNSEGLMIEDVIEWREALAAGLGQPPRA